MILLLLLSIIGLGALLSAASGKLSETVKPWIIPLPAFGAFFIAAALVAPQVLAGESVAFSQPWVPYLDLSFSLSVGGMGLLLALLVTGIGSLILLYATGYMAGHPQANRLYAYLYGFMFAMAGLAFSDHLLLIFVFWELTSITSYLLIGFNHEKEASRKNALQALLVTGLGGMALLAAFILVRNAVGSWSLGDVLGARDVLINHAHYGAILTLVLVGAFTKSAQFPFHFWLPNAMAAPTPVSAYLHSATMVKAGVFLLAVLSPALGGTAAWTTALCVAGGVTLLLGAFFGLLQTDLKKILAGTTLAVLGLITFLLGVGGEYGTLAAILVLLGHALYKATLFMVAGAVDHETGTRDVRMLGGLRTVMPWTAAAALMAGLSKMGLPPFYGFLGKEYAYKAGLKTELSWLTNGVILFGSAILLALALRTAVAPFWQKKSFAPLPKHPHEAPFSMRLGPLVLASLGVIIGLMPGLAAPLVSAANSSVLGYAVQPEVKIWAGFNLPLLLSVCTVVLGLIIYRFSSRLQEKLSALSLPSMEAVYHRMLSAVVAFANWQTRVLQSGYLRNYIRIIVVVTAGLIINKLIRLGGIPPLLSGGEFSLSVVVMAVLMLGGIWMAITTTSRLAALIALGVVGFGVALIFAVYSAPDLAITQILVETLTVVLFAWVVYKLPDFRVLSPKRARLTDAVISLTMGAVITILLLKSKAVELAPTISHKLAEMSLPEAYGANVVNVILVDFRALDTWGEVTVLAIAALGVTALLKNTRTKNAFKKP